MRIIDIYRSYIEMSPKAFGLLVAGSLVIGVIIGAAVAG